MRFAVLLLLLAPFFAVAQTVPFLETSLELVTIPSAPRAGETVTVRAVNISAPGNTTFVWRVNGSVVDQGLGVSAITITTRALGIPTTVSVSAFENGQAKAEKSITITPSEIDLVWEGNTYTPPLFEGLPRPNPSSSVTFLAVPGIVSFGQRVPAGSLVYTWYVNGSQFPLVSGYGKSSITIKPPQFLNPFTVRVVAETGDGSVRTEAQTEVKPIRPQIVIYEKAALLGYRFDRAVGGALQLEGDEVTLTAFPLFVNSLRAPTYSWSINGSAVSDTEDEGKEITLRKTGEGRGAFSLSFSLENAAALFEKASAAFLLTF